MGVPKYNKGEWAESYQHRRILRMEKVDEIPDDLKPIVHEWGLTIYEALWQCGIRKPNHMAHIIQTVLNETRGSTDRQKGSYQK